MPKSTLFFPYKGSVLDPPKNKLQRRVFAMWDFNYSYLVYPKEKLLLSFIYFSSLRILLELFFFLIFFMGILLDTYKVQKHRAKAFLFILLKKKKKNAFLFMVEVNIGLKIILKNVLWKKKK